MSKLKPGWQLLTVLSVEPSEHVRCECPGCHFKIYATIIVLVWPGTDDIQFWGEDCFKRESGKPYKKFTPFLNEKYDGKGRKLTEDERQLLDLNRAALIALLRDENEAFKQARLAQEALQRKIDEEQKAHLENLRRQREQAEAERARIKAEKERQEQLKAEAERARREAEEAERARRKAEEAERAKFRAVLTLHEGGQDQVQELMAETLFEARLFITTNIKRKWIGEVIDLETDEVVYQMTAGKVFIDRMLA